MISRIWHGYTTRDNADEYETLLKQEVFTGIGERHIPGVQEIQLIGRKLEEEAEFVTLMWVGTLVAVRLFAGEEYALAVVQPRARPLLKRFDERSQHNGVRERMRPKTP